MNGSSHGSQSMATQKGGNANPSSSPPAPSLKERLEKIEAVIPLINELHAVFFPDGQSNMNPIKDGYFNEAEYKQAILALRDGDRGKKLDAYVKRGGRIPGKGKKL